MGLAVAGEDMRQRQDELGLSTGCCCLRKKVRGGTVGQGRVGQGEARQGRAGQGKVGGATAAGQGSAG